MSGVGGRPEVAGRMRKAEIVPETSRKVLSPAGSRGKIIGFIDPALEASENVSKNRFAFGNSVFSDGVGL